MGRVEVQELLDIFARRHPRLVDELIPNVLSLADGVAVIRRLLREGVSVRDLRTIIEALADHGRTTKDADLLTEHVRLALGRQITSRFKDNQGRVGALVLDPTAEQAFREGLAAGSAQRVLASLETGSRGFAGVSTPPAVICAPDVRRQVFDFLSRRVPGISVLSFREIDGSATIRSLGVVSA